LIPQASSRWTPVRPIETIPGQVVTIILPWHPGCPWYSPFHPNIHLHPHERGHLAGTVVKRPTGTLRSIHQGAAAQKSVSRSAGVPTVTRRGIHRGSVGRESVDRSPSLHAEAERDARRVYRDQYTVTLMKSIFGAARRAPVVESTMHLRHRYSQESSRRVLVRRAIPVAF